MEIAEKRETENNINTLDSVDDAKETEERHARELKAGLHPLKGFGSSTTTRLDHLLYRVPLICIFSRRAYALCRRILLSNSGKWIIRFKKSVSGRFWEDLGTAAEV